MTRRHGATGLPDDTIRITFTGSAGQSFGAFVPRGHDDDAGRRRQRRLRQGTVGRQADRVPPPLSTFKSQENIIIGNVAFYGATSGEGYVRGVAGERFCVRNSGARWWSRALAITAAST